MSYLKGVGAFTNQLPTSARSANDHTGRVFALASTQNSGATTLLYGWSEVE